MFDNLTRPEAIDPRTFHMEGPHGSLVDHLRASLQLAQQAAMKTDQAVLLYLDEKNGEPAYKFHRAPVEKLHAEATFPCPRAADEVFEKDAGIPRPLPSAVIYPDGFTVVSKPSLCEGCSHYLKRAVQGHCYGLPYLPLHDALKEIA